MPARTSSFRLPSELIAALDDRARAQGDTRTAVAERYLREGLRREDHPLIVFREGAAGRRPALAGTRLDVAQVIDTLRESGNSITATAEYLAIPESLVRAAVSYYAEFRDEVDDWRERMHAIAEREEEAWRRAQDVLS